jgi:hypothetical protein
MWTLDEALVIIRRLQPYLRDLQYHVVLGGGVLNKGESKKDLDLYFLPLDVDTGTAKPEDMVKLLNATWNFKSEIGYGSDMVFQHKKIYETDAGKRIDVFIAPKLDTTP